MTQLGTILSEPLSMQFFLSIKSWFGKCICPTEGERWRSATHHQTARLKVSETPYRASLPHHREKQNKSRHSESSSTMGSFKCKHPFWLEYLEFPPSTITPISTFE